MKIGNIQLDNPVILAPLAGISDLPFRMLAKRAGCGLVYSEMVSANGLVHGSPKTHLLLKERILSESFSSGSAIPLGDLEGKCRKGLKWDWDQE